MTTASSRLRALCKRRASRLEKRIAMLVRNYMDQDEGIDSDERILQGEVQMYGRYGLHGDSYRLERWTDIALHQRALEIQKRRWEHDNGEQ